MPPSKGRGRFDRALLAFRARNPLRRPRPSRPADLPRDSSKPLARLAADQLFSRISGADSVQGNSLTLLQDGEANYEAWLGAIAAARHWVHLENYIIRNDRIGQRFAAALIARAQAGVTVRVLFDWMGCLGTSPLFWRRLRRGGIEVRCFNRPRLDSPFGWLSRNHRKTLSVDGRQAFVSGLCIGQAWLGDPARSIEPWRDTGVALAGPAVADVEAAFADSWAYADGAIPAADTRPPPAPAGAVALRVVGTHPGTMGIYRADQMIAALARHRLWLTDAYFVGTTAYVRALCDAAQDGVDVRLLVPGASDIPVAKALSRAGYRPLLEAGIRVFEWSGPMLHAKTAVADGRWGRIGSSNLNLASWMGNWELDVAVEDLAFATSMEAMFESDLSHATEIVLDGSTVHAANRTGRSGRARGSPGRLAAGAVGIGSTVGAAITNHRALGPAEATVMGSAGAVLLVVAVLAIAAPLLLTVPISVLSAWVATTLLIRAGRLRLSRTRPPADPA